jgi:uncharacterized protein (DUF58 family)
MAGKRTAGIGAGVVNGSIAYDLGRPDLWPEYDYGRDVSIPEAPELGEEVVAGRAAATAQAISPVAALGFVIAAVLLVFSLFARIQLTQLSDECVALESSLAALNDTNTKLRISYESEFNLTEIEDYAVDTLGMVKPRSNQIYYVSGSVQDHAVVLGEAAEDVSFADRLGDFLSSFTSYFHKGAE